MRVTDRSRYMEGFYCPMARFLRYHWRGTGIVKQGTYMPLATGTYTHEALEAILRHAIIWQEAGDWRTEIFSDPAKEAVKSAIQQAVQHYQDEVRSRGLIDLGEGDESIEWVIKEQSHLIACLAWGWYRAMLPGFLREFKVISAEQEEFVILNCNCAAAGKWDPREHEQAHCSGLAQMSRPDFVARRLADGKLGVHDFKTSSYLNDFYVEGFKDSVQMAVGTLGVENRLQEPVDHFYVHVLLKGSRKPFTRKEVATAPRQMSELCYSRIQHAAPPFSDTVLLTGGYWVDKTPLWECLTPEDQMMKVAKEADLFQHFALLGPYERQAALIPSYLQGVVGEEVKWEGLESSLSELEKSYGWESSEFQDALSYSVGRSWNCHQFGKGACGYIPICFRHPGWKDPLSGSYVIREAHHALEAERFE